MFPARILPSGERTNRRPRAAGPTERRNALSELWPGDGRQWMVYIPRHIPRGLGLRPNRRTAPRSGRVAAWALCLALCLASACLTAFPARAAENGPRIQLFGTVEFRRPLKSLPAWLEMLARNEKSPIFVAGSRFNASTTWEQFRARAEKLSRREQLKMVNVFWNKWPYREDKDVYGKPDYWAAPSEFRKNSGDCEDYSIAKYFTLKALGVPADKMRIVVLKETIRNLAHAVLVVYMDNDAWVLDNMSNNVLSHTRYKSYLPQFSVNEHNRWAHVKPKK